LIVGLLQTLDGDTDADLREFLAKIHDAIGKEAVGGDDDTLALLIKLAHDVLEILADEGLAACDIGKVHGRQLADGLQRNLLFRAGGLFVSIAHIAPCVAPIGDDHSAVEFFSHCFSPFAGACGFYPA
jgi:hypothetical protein